MINTIIVSGKEVIPRNSRSCDSGVRVSLLDIVDVHPDTLSASTRTSNHDLSRLLEVVHFIEIVENVSQNNVARKI